MRLTNLWARLPETVAGLPRGIGLLVLVCASQTIPAAAEPFTDAVSREFSVFNNTLGHPPIEDAVSRPFSIYNNTFEHPPLADAISRLFTVYNNLQAVPAIDDITSRELTVFNNTLAAVSIEDAIARSATVFNNRVTPFGGDCADEAVTFVWDPVETATAYRLDVASAPAEADIFDQVFVGDTLAHAYPVALPEGEHYFARIAATPDEGMHYFPGPFSSGTVVDHTDPVANAPTGQLYDDNEIRFEFSGADNEYVAGYHVQVAIDVDFAMVILDTTVLVPQGLSMQGQPGETHFARAAAIDCAGNEGLFGEHSNGIVLAPLPDLSVAQITVPPSIYSGQTLHVDWRVENLGPGGTNSPVWEDALYLSADSLLDAESDVLLGQDENISYLQPNEFYENGLEVQTPDGIVGTYRVLVVADVDEEMAEVESANNVGVSEDLEIELAPYPDLQVTSVQAPTAAFTGDSISVTWIVENLGPGTTGSAEWRDCVVYSEDASLDFLLTHGGALRILDDHIGSHPHEGALAPGESYEASITGQIPIDALAYTARNRSEIGYVFVFADHGGTAVFPHYAERGDVYEYLQEFNNWTGDSLDVVLRPPPDVTVESFYIPPNGVSGDTITITYTVGNAGFGPTFETWWYDRISLSSLPEYDPSNELVHRGYTRQGVLDVDSSYTHEAAVLLPYDAEGDYYAYVHTDWMEMVYEHGEDENNVARSENQVTVSLQPWPNLVVQSLTIEEPPVAGTAVTARWTVLNDGDGATQAPWWNDGIYLSRSAEFGDSSQVCLGLSERNDALDPDTAYEQVAQFHLPLDATGPVYFHLLTDAHEDVFEHVDEGDNVMTSALFDVPAYPPVDLVVSDVDLPSVAGIGGELPIGWTITNEGEAPTLAEQWIGRAYLSVNDQLDPEEDVLIASPSRQGVLEDGSSYTRNLEIRLSEDLAGEYYLIVEADPEGLVLDADRENNVLASATSVLIDVLPSPDLHASALDADPTGVAGQPITVAWEVTNLGEPVPASAQWHDAIFLSLDAYLDPFDEALGSLTKTGGLGGSSSYTEGLSVELPGFVAGGYHILLSTDDGNGVYECLAEDNNLRAAPITVFLPDPSDLVVTQVDAPPGAVPAESLVISWTVDNQGSYPAEGIMRDGVYVSLDEVFDLDDPLVGIFEDSVSIAPGGVKRWTRRVGLDQTYRIRSDGSIEDALPGVDPGDYYFIAKTDIRSNIRETDDDNNAASTTTTTHVSVTPLPLDSPFTTAMIEGQRIYFALDVAAGDDLRITLTADPTTVGNELYVAYDRVPTENDYDYASKTPFTADHVLSVPSPQSGTHYLLLLARTFPETVEAEGITVLAEALSPAIASITPDAGGHDGAVTCLLEGAGFRENMTVWLAQEGERLHPGELIEYQHSMAARVRWDLEDVALGTYDVHAEIPNETDIELPFGFIVEESTAPEVVFSSQTPEYVRWGGTSYNTFTLTNVSNNDLPYLTVTVNYPAGTTGAVNTSGLLSHSDLLTGVVEEPIQNTFPNLVHESLTEVIPLIARDVPPGGSVSATLEFSEFSLFPFEFSVVPVVMDPDHYIAITLLAGEATRQAMVDTLLSLGEIPEPELEDGAAFMDMVIEMYEQVGLFDEGAAEDLIARLAEGPPGPFARDRTQDDFGEIIEDIETFLEDGPGTIKDATWGQLTDCLEDAWEVIQGEEPECYDTAEWLCFGCMELAGYSAIMFCGFAGPGAAACIGGVLVGVGIGVDIGEFLVCSGVVLPCDPNEIVGPAAYGDEHWVGKQRTLGYTIHYENDPELATAPAQIVEIRQTLDADLDPASFRLADFGFGPHGFEVPENSAFYSEQLDLREEMDLFVEFAAGIDVQTNEVFWRLKSIDPETGELPTDPFAGFLPVNDPETGDGQGYVNYTIRPRDTVATGDIIDAEAAIVFDTNAPVVTPAIFNTIDADAPVSAVDSLPSIISTESFLVSLTGDDLTPGSGLDTGRLYVSDDGAPFELAGTADLDTQGSGTLVFTGERGHTYGFFSIVEDHSGNIEAMKSEAEQIVIIGTEAIVWPGDCNNNGIVNQNDLLPIGLYFGVTGPLRPGASLEWEGQPTLAWEPDEATYADADGDGTVDQNDMLAIGLNFGQTHERGRSPVPASAENTLSLLIPPLPAGSVFPVEVVLASPVDAHEGLFGFGLAVEIPKQIFAVDSVIVCDELDDGQLLEFHRWDEERDLLSMAFSRKRGQPGARGFEGGDTVVRILLEVVGTMKADAEIRLLDGAVTCATGPLAAPAWRIESTAAAPRPLHFVLAENRPNPFSSPTVIRFGVPHESAVSIEVFDVTGRLAKCLARDKVYPAGWHSVRLEGADMGCGVYFCRMKAEGFEASRKIVLMR